MKQQSSTGISSRADWKRVQALRDEEISLSAEHPEASVDHIVRGIVRRGLAADPPEGSISQVDAAGAGPADDVT